ncbi:MAG: hypothetical protein JXA67_01285 [Micromonosporaceae bacterium]|nr:hypothetical protein [Micromonosporaceae bacterium]
MTQPPSYPSYPNDPYGQQPPDQQPPGQYSAPPFGTQQPYVPPGQPVSGMPYPPVQPMSGAPFSPGQQGQPFGQAGYQQPAGYGTDPFAQQPFAQQPFAQGDPMFGQPAPRSGKGLLITIIVLVCLVVLGGGGTAAYLIFGRSEGTGAADPVKAVDQFLTAVFKDKNVEAANKIICASAQDSKAMRNRIQQLRDFELKYKSPAYTWPTPTVESRKSESAVVTTTVKLTTSDDRVAEQRLKFLTVEGDGWLVCEINPG